MNLFEQSLIAAFAHAAVSLLKLFLAEYFRQILTVGHLIGLDVSADRMFQVRHHPQIDECVANESFPDAKVII